jgi:hypothetical protein
VCDLPTEIELDGTRQGRSVADTKTALSHSTAVMSIHCYIALSLGVFFSILIGCGLMGLMFYSSRRGYDEQPEFTVTNDDN